MLCEGNVMWIPGRKKEAWRQGSCPWVIARVIADGGARACS